jgi:hypothetical protein
MEDLRISTNTSHLRDKEYRKNNVEPEQAVELPCKGDE